MRNSYISARPQQSLQSPLHIIWEDCLLQHVENAVLLNCVHCLSSNAILLFWQLFAGHFDTSVGPKIESTSYMNIVKKLECKSEDVLFLTDVPRGKMWQYSDFTGAVQLSWLQCLPSIFWCVSQYPCCILILARNVWFHVICSLFLGVNCTANGSQSADVPQCLLSKPFHIPFVWRIFDSFVSCYAKCHIMFWLTQCWIWMCSFMCSDNTDDKEFCHKRWVSHIGVFWICHALLLAELFLTFLVDCSAFICKGQGGTIDPITWSHTPENLCHLEFIIVGYSGFSSLTKMHCLSWFPRSK